MVIVSKFNETASNPSRGEWQLLYNVDIRGWTESEGLLIFRINRIPFVFVGPDFFDQPSERGVFKKIRRIGGKDWKKKKRIKENVLLQRGGTWWRGGRRELIFRPVTQERSDKLLFVNGIKRLNSRYVTKFASQMEYFAGNKPAPFRRPLSPPHLSPFSPCWIFRNSDYTAKHPISWTLFMSASFMTDFISGRRVRYGGE